VDLEEEKDVFERDSEEDFQKESLQSDYLNL
jgi:hypothetical protein